ncbi:hypothetical protein BDN72DRAFT_862271 [Pluteus cervinus]|uniref:Uncharacterized protein n=1 Tax=Pluteus cervinus TaxID=181527 RepID=A0ACD3AC98_9AGAR|nr:hypothetical protein BDN72DRAFT_862271 [Pluteus cervinus]
MSTPNAYSRDAAIVPHIFKVLLAVDQVSFGMASRLHYDLLLKFRTEAYLAKNILSFFFKPGQITAFRALLETTHAIIGGSAAISFFQRTHPGKELDVFVEGTRARPLLAWLRLNFQVVKPSVSSIKAAYFSETAVCEVFVFNGNKRSIKVLTTYRSAVEAVLRSSLTCTMNFITHEAAYFLFPLETFQRGEAFATGGMYDPSTARFRRMYEERGWRLNTGSLNRACQLRYIGDRQCWRIGDIFLETQMDAGKQHGPLDFFYSFEVVYAPITNIVFRCLREGILGHQYTYPDRLEVRSFWLKMKEKRLDEPQVQLELKFFLGKLQDNFVDPLEAVFRNS